MNKTAQFFDGKTILITGATGFLGQPLVEKILYASPGIARIHVLIRPKRVSPGVVLDAAKRLERELYDSSVFDRLRAVHGDALLPFLLDKLVAVAGDISQEGLGIEPELAATLRDSVDVVINSAAVVSFDAPLDDALRLNVEGAQRVAQFAASCRHALLVHVSTAYVCGATHSVATETLYHTAPDGTAETFPRGMFSDVGADLKRIRDIIDQCEVESRSAEVEREFTRILLERSRSARSGKTSGRRKVIESLRRKWLDNRLVAAGMEWARARGWNDTYTYTKALGEQMVMRACAGRPLVIVRPSVIESSLSEPTPGWLDGLRMADPLILAIGKGRLRSLPLRPDVNLDLVPVDMVVNALLAATPRATQSTGLQIYQVATGSRNPISLGALYDFIYRYFTRNPMLDKAGRPIRIQPLRFPSKSLFRLQHRLRSWPLHRAERTLERLSNIRGASRAKRRVSATRAANERLFYYGSIYEPYLNIECRFEVDRTLALYESLDADERAMFGFDVSQLNWRHYIQNVHIPGIKRYILKQEGQGAARLDVPRDAADTAPQTIPEVVQQSATRFGDKTALQIRRGGDWQRVSYAELARAAAEVAVRLRAAGLRHGDRVVLYSENQPEWGMAYLGAVSLGLTVVPLDAQTWHREVWSIARFTAARAILASASCFKRFTPASVLENERAETPLQILDVGARCAPFALAEYPRSTAGTPPGPPRPASTAAVAPDDPASIIFTSGTASDPKGAVHTHRGFLANMQGVVAIAPPLGPTDDLLSVLPLYHALEFTCGFLAPLWLGVTVTYAASLKPRNLVDTMRETGTTYMMGVPTLHALIRDEIERRVLKGERTGRRTESAGATLDRGPLARTLRGRARQDLQARVRKAMGGKLRFLVSGGSGLGTDLYEDFFALGIPIYEGYGLTETAPVLTFNPSEKTRAGSVGKPLPGIELRLSRPDRDGIGEIVVRTPGLMLGYDRNPQATAKAIRDGWFHTGDLGWVDEDGYVYITGRIKDVIVTGAGKNVYPGDLEAIYSSVAGVKEICVLGVKSGLTEEVHAVIVPDSSATAASSEGDARKAIQREMQALAKDLPSYHRLQAVHLWREPLPRDADGALQREEIARRVQAEVDRSQARPAPAAPAAVAAAGAHDEELLVELARLSGVAAADIRAESDLYGDLGLDSIEAIELLLFLETHFGIAVPDEKADAIRTVGDLRRELAALSTAPASAARVENLPSLYPTSQRSPFDRALLRCALASVSALYKRYFRFTRADVEGTLPESGPYILAANHSSHLDVGAIMAAVTARRGRAEAERLHVLGARDYFFNKPLKSWFFSRFFNVVPIRREQTGLDGLRTAKGILAKGEPVLIFPEATRSRSGKMQVFKPGLGLLAYEANVPVIPAYIQGTYAALPAGKVLPKSLPLKIKFGAPLHMEDYRRSGTSVARDELYRRISQDVRERIEALAARA